MKNEIIKHQFEVGQVVYFYEGKLRQKDQDSIRETKIAKVGNKYITLELWNIRIDKFTLIEVIEYAVGGRLYLSLNEYESEKEHNELSDRLKKIFSHWGKPPYTNEQLKKVLEILNEEI